MTPLDANCEGGYRWGVCPDVRVGQSGDGFHQTAPYQAGTLPHLRAHSHPGGALPNGVAMYVYFIVTEKTKGGGKCRMKIGKAKNPEKRLKQLQTGNPSPLKLIGKIKCSSEKHAFEVEKAAHRYFNSSNLRAEWFKVTDTVLVKVYEWTAIAESRERSLGRVGA